MLTNHIFPGKSEVFGIAMTFCAIGGIVATVVLPTILNHLSSKMYYLSSLLFGLSQWARTTNRVYFQHSVKDYERGKVLSIVMMDRGMIPLGSLVMSFFADVFGILTTFLIKFITIWTCFIRRRYTQFGYHVHMYYFNWTI